MNWIKSEKNNFGSFKESIKFNRYWRLWKREKIITIFENRIFKLNNMNKNTWKDAIEYGKTQGILVEQLES